MTPNDILLKNADLLVMQFSSHDYLVFSFTLVIGILVIVTIIRWTAIHFGI